MYTLCSVLHLDEIHDNGFIRLKENLATFIRFNRMPYTISHVPLAGYVKLRVAGYVKLRVAHEAEMPGTFSPSPRVTDPDMHHGTCVTHVPWCMRGLLTSCFRWSRWREKAFQAFPAHAHPVRNFTYLVRGPCLQVLYGFVSSTFHFQVTSGIRIKWYQKRWLLKKNSHSICCNGVLFVKVESDINVIPL